MCACVRACLCWDVCECEVKIRTATPSFSVDAGDPALDPLYPTEPSLASLIDS